MGVDTELLVKCPGKHLGRGRGGVTVFVVKA